MSQTNFFAVDTIQVIKIHFPQSNWDYVMDTAKAGAEGYTTADTVTVNGVNYFSVGVKYKGSSSFDSTRAKNPLHIKLDYLISNANYHGVEDIKLSNGFSDPSMVREVLGYYIARNYMDAPLCNFAKVYINGTYYGVYSNAHDIDNPFLLDHFYSSTGSFFKANPENILNGHLPSLVYLGTDSTDYYDRYELKSDYGWNDLINLCDTLVNTPAAIADALDVDRALWMLAFNNVAVNLDSYTGAFAQNYYLYRDRTGRFNPILWDLNMCFGAFTNTGSANLNLASMQTMSPVLQSANTSRPLIMNLLANSSYKKMYVAHMRTINDEFFLNGSYLSDGAIFQALIDTSVQAENFSLFTYPQFQQGLTNSNGGVVGVGELMNNRATFLDSTAEFQLVPPAISGIAAAPVTPSFGNSFTITGSVTNATSVFLGYRYAKSDAFVRVPMFDNGLHGDGSAGDFVYGASLTANSLHIQYYLYAENADAGMFAPERAEHEFYSVLPSIAPATPGDVVLNEFVALNTNGIMDEAGKFRDWIELYNLTSNPLGIHNLYLSDDFTNQLKWRFPAEAFIPANGHLLVWADGEDENWIELHTNFSLASTGDSLLLADSNAVWLDSISMVAPNPNYALARCPDGTGGFQLTVVTTPRATNFCSIISVEPPSAADISISLFPNPSDGVLHYSVAGDFVPASISVSDVAGQIIFTLPGNREGDLDVSGLPASVYWVSFVGVDGARRVFRVVRI